MKYKKLIIITIYFLFHLTALKSQELISSMVINDITHNGPLTPIRLAFDPKNDNRFAVVDVSDGTIGVWSFNKKFIREYLIDAKAVAVAFSPDGKIIASSNINGEIYLWNNNGKKLKGPILGHNGSIQDLAFSPDGKLLVSGGYDHTVRIWNLNDLTKTKVLIGHTAWVRSVSFSPDNDLIVSSGIDGNVMLWNKNGKLKAGPLKGHKKWVESVSFSPSGKLFASAGDDGFVRLWKLDGSLYTKPLGGHRAWIVDFFPCGNLIASSGEDGSIIIRNIQNLKQKTKFKKHFGSVQALAFSSNCNFFATGGYYDGTVRIWNINGTEHIEPLRSHPAWLRPLDYDLETNTLALGGDNGSLRFFNLATQKTSKSHLGHTKWIEVARYVNKDNIKLLITGGYDGKVILWNNDGLVLSSHQKHKSKIKALSSSNKKEVIVSGDEIGDIVLSDLNNNIKFIKEHAHDGEVLSLRALTKKNIIISTGKDNKIKFWNYLGKLVKEWEYSNREIIGLTVSDDEDLFGLYFNNGKIEIWSIDNLKKISDINTNQNQIKTITFSPENKIIISSATNGTIKIWKLNGQKIGNTIYGHNGYANKIFFLENKENFITTGYFDNKISTWSFKDF